MEMFQNPGHCFDFVFFGKQNVEKCSPFSESKPILLSGFLLSKYIIHSCNAGSLGFFL